MIESTNTAKNLTVVEIGYGAPIPHLASLLLSPPCSTFSYRKSDLLNPPGLFITVEPTRILTCRSDSTPDTLEPGKAQTS